MLDDTCPRCGRGPTPAERALAMLRGRELPADVVASTGLSLRQVQRLARDAGLARPRGRQPRVHTTPRSLSKTLPKMGDL